MSATVQQEQFEPQKSDIERSLQRVLTGHSFRSSAQCQALLRYIVEHSLSRENEMLRERMIGIEVFGRAPDYDSGNDPIVRARAAEVRKRLAQHYMHGEGAGEELRIEIPPGSYRAIFAAADRSGTSEGSADAEPDARLPGASASRISEKRDSSESNARGIEDTSQPEEFEPRDADQATRSRKRFTPRLAVLASVASVTAILGFAAGFFLTNHRTATQRDLQGSQESVAASSDPVGAFWGPFIKQDRSPIIAYADAMFLIDGSGDLFRFRHGASDNRGASVDSHLARQFASNPGLIAGAGPLSYDNGYTGTGDLRAMAMLISQLAHQGATPLVESSYDISTDELKQHNVIFLGSSAENLAVAQLVPGGDFLFAGPASNRDPWSGEIVNSRPRSGEQPTYATVRDPVTHVLQQDYALISFQSGITPEHQIAILGGIDTTGTEGAALFVTSNVGIEELSKSLAQVNTEAQNGRSGAFQALVRVDVKKGYQVLGSHLVTIHFLNAAKPATPIPSPAP